MARKSSGTGEASPGGGEELEKRRREALERAVGQIRHSFGEAAITRLGDRPTQGVPSISTGALSLDLALGVGGVPRGRIAEIFGPEASGKTTLALSIAKSAQRDGGIAAVVDAEHAIDPGWAEKIGVDVNNLLVSQPDTGEQALEIVEALVRSNAVDVIIVDSVAALVPRAEIEGEMGEPHVGLVARLMSQALRKLVGSINRSRAVVVFINQLRQKIGVVYGPPETTPGGMALKYAASVRLDVRRLGNVRVGDVAVGMTVRCTVKKNKVAAPYKTADFDIMFDSGISYEGTVLDMGVAYKVVEKSGAWLSFAETRLGQGRENAKRFLSENPDLTAAIRDRVWEKVGLAGADRQGESDAAISPEEPSPVE